MGLMGSGPKPSHVHPKGSPYAQQQQHGLPGISGNIFPPPSYNNAPTPSGGMGLAMPYSNLGGGIGSLNPTPFPYNSNQRPPPLSALNNFSIAKASMGNLNSMPSLRVNTNAPMNTNSMNMLPSLNSNANLNQQGPPMLNPSFNTLPVINAMPPLNFINTNVNPANMGALPNPYAPSPLYNANLAPNPYANLNHNMFNSSLNNQSG
jgi:hypothetical protein